MMSIPPRDMEPVRPASEVKTVEVARPLDEKRIADPGPLGFGWRRSYVDYGADGKATVYQHDDALTDRRPVI